MMQINVENVFNNIFQVIIFRKLQELWDLWWTLSPSSCYFIVFIILFSTNMGNMRKGSLLLNFFWHEVRWPPRRSFIYFGPLFIIPRNHYMSPQLCLSILANDTHIVGKIIPTFDHLLTRLAIVGLKVKVSKCKLWSPSQIFLSIETP